MFPLKSASNVLTPDESAPSYDELFADHPVNQHRPSGSSSAYAAVPQDDAEQQQERQLQLQHYHATDSDPEANAGSSSDTPLPTTHALPYDVSKPHVHCEACDKIMHRREHAARQSHCCQMVAVTFISCFVFAMILGIIIVAKVVR